MSEPALRSPLNTGRVPKIAEDAIRRARLSVVPRRIAEAPRVPFVALMTFVVIAGVIGLLMFNTSMQQASFTASGLAQQAEILTARQEALQSDIETLRDPQRVAQAAQDLGMVPAGSPAFIDLNTGKVSGVPSAATRADDIRLVPLPPKKPAVLAPKKVVIEVPATVSDAAAAGAALPEKKTKKAQKTRNQ